jgi:hypothetical protein
MLNPLQSPGDDSHPTLNPSENTVVDAVTLVLELVSSVFFTVIAAHDPTCETGTLKT